MGLDAPNEFYHYIPKGELLAYVDDPAASICGGASGCVGIAPVVDNLISIGAAHDATLRDLAISHGGDGGEKVFTAYGSGSAGSMQVSSEVSNATITRCDLRHGGTNGIQGGFDGGGSATGLRGVTISECKIEDLGAEAISMADPHAEDVLISDNVVGETGKIAPQSARALRALGILRPSLARARCALRK